MNPVIKPWLSTGLIVALASNVMLSAILIIRLSSFDDMKKQAEETASLANQKSTELAGLRVEVESLTKQKDLLAPAVADWEKRLKEKATAEAALAVLEAKHLQTESELSEGEKRLEGISKSLAEAQKRRADMAAALEVLSSEVAALTRTNIDTKAQLNLAADAQRRHAEAMNALVNADARRRQLEADAAAAQARFDQAQKEADDLRQTRDKLNTETTTLRNQLQSLKERLVTLEQSSADLKIQQTTAQQEEQRRLKAEQQLATVESRAAEMESRYRQAASDFAQLTNRIIEARAQTTNLEIKRDTSQQAAAKAAQDLAAAQRLLAETQATYDLVSREQTKAAAQFTASKMQLEQARRDLVDSEARLELTKAALQKSEAETVAARKLSQEFSAMQGELTRDVSRLETSVERLKKEKEGLEKDIGRLEAQRQKAP